MTSETQLGLWPKTKFEEMGDQCKTREEFCRTLTHIDNKEDFAIRVDGRAFHTFTRNLEKPFSEPFMKAMKAAATEVLTNMKCQFVYFQSDEITYVFKGGRSRNQDMYQHPFGGRVDKLLSVVAALTSVAFFKAAFMNGLTGEGKQLPHFDARLVEVGGGFKAMIDSVMWRENDAIRNAVSMVAQSKYSQKDLQGKNIDKQLQMIELSNFCETNGQQYTQTYTSAQRRGTFLRSGKEERELTDVELLQIPAHFRPDEGTVFTRTVIRELAFETWDYDTRREGLWE